MQEQLTIDPYIVGAGEFNIRHHLGVLRGRFWTILACVVVLFTVAAVYAFRATPISEASARLLIERSLPVVGPFQEVRERRDKEYFSTQVNLITSKAVLDRALEDERFAGLFEEDEARDVSSPGLWRSVVREVRAVLDEDSFRPRQPWERLRAVVAVRPLKDTNLVDLKVRGPNPELGALIANTVARAYVSYSVAMRQESAGQAFDMLQRQMREQEKAVVEAEDDLLSYREQATIPELGSPGEESPVTSRRRALNDEYTRVQLRRIELSVAAQAIRQEQESGQDLNSMLGVALVRSDSAVQELYSRLMQVELDAQVALRSYGGKHPEVLMLDDQRVHLVARLQDAIARVAQSIQAEHVMLLAREGELTSALARESDLALDQARTSHVYGRLERDAARQGRVFDVIVDRMKEVDLTKDAGVTNVSLVEAAAAPQSPIKPNKKRALILGALLGLLMGLGLAYGLEYLDDTVKTPDDVEKRLSMPWLGYVPRMRPARGRDGFVGLAQHTLIHPSSSHTEAFRSIRTNVYFSRPRGEMKSLMVTSAAPQDGKSIFASNLAVTVAQDGKRVLLVDADLRRPTLHKAFELDRGPGLTNMLVEGKRLEDLVQSPPDGGNGKLENLHILCAGSKAPNPAELLGGEAMDRFVRETREQYDMVIYDACPAMFVADAAGLASGCDGVLIVLKAAKSRRDAAERARRQLEALNGKIIGVVLNDVRPRILRYYGSYGYYYYDYQRYYKDYGDKEPDTLKLVIPTAAAAKPEATAAVAEQEPEPTADEDAPRAVSFSMRSGDERSLSFGLKDGEEVVLGRDAAECNFTLPDVAISRVHCRIANIGGNILVEDLGTTNGTYVNDERVQKAEVSLGDVIRIGRYEISVGGSPSGHGA